MATQITPEIIELIKKYRIENKLGSGKLSEILKANHNLDVGRSTITKILKKLVSVRASIREEKGMSAEQ